MAVIVAIFNLSKLSMMLTQYHSEHLTLLTESSKILQTIHYFIHVGHFQNEPHLGGHLGGHLEFLKTSMMSAPLRVQTVSCPLINQQ